MVWRLNLLLTQFCPEGLAYISCIRLGWDALKCFEFESACGYKKPREMSEHIYLYWSRRLACSSCDGGRKQSCHCFHLIFSFSFYVFAFHPLQGYSKSWNFVSLHISAQLEGISIFYFAFGVFIFYMSYYGAKLKGTLINIGE